MVGLDDLQWLLAAIVGAYISFKLFQIGTKRKFMPDAWYFILGIACQFVVAALIAKYGLRLSWASVGAACMLWITPLALIAIGGGMNDEAKGWAFGFGMLLTLPAVVFAAVVIKLFLGIFARSQ